MRVGDGGKGGEREGREGREIEGCGGRRGCITQEKYAPHDTQSSVCKRNTVAVKYVAGPKYA